MKKSIEVIGLTKTYGTQHALDNVSLEVGSGEVIGLLGPNGAGKSTLMKIISCFIPPSSGDVRVLGYDIFSDAHEVRKRVGYLPENNPLYIDMYVKEYLHFVAGIHLLKDIAKRVDEMVGLTGLGREQHKRIGALSKGYRQRVGLAQALIHDPEVLILDEPTSGLDPNQLTEIRNLIRETGRSRTVMLSTHIMQEVEAVCDRVIIIDKGRIVADERTEKLTTLLAGTTLLEIEFSSPVDPVKISRIKGVHSVKDKAKGMTEVQVVQGHDVREEIFNLAVSEGVKVLSMSRVEQKLEEIFQVLTSGS